MRRRRQQTSRPPAPHSAERTGRPRPRLSPRRSAAEARAPARSRWHAAAPARGWRTSEWVNRSCSAADEIGGRLRRPSRRSVRPSRRVARQARRSARACPRVRVAPSTPRCDPGREVAQRAAEEPPEPPELHPRSWPRSCQPWRTPTRHRAPPSPRPPFRMLVRRRACHLPGRRFGRSAAARHRARAPPPARAPAPSCRGFQRRRQAVPQRARSPRAPRLLCSRPRWRLPRPRLRAAAPRTSDGQHARPP